MSNFQFESMVAFFLMGGHGIYIWPAYFITIVLIMFLVQMPIWQKRHFLMQLRRQQRIDKLSTKNSKV